MYKLIVSHCKKLEAGGQAPGTGENIVRAVNDPNYKPPSRVKRVAKGELITYTVTTAEAEKMVKKGREANKPSQKREVSKLFTIPVSLHSLTTAATGLPVDSHRRIQKRHHRRARPPKRHRRLWRFPTMVHNRRLLNDLQLNRLD
jgi:hypothetical protein